MGYDDDDDEFEGYEDYGADDVDCDAEEDDDGVTVPCPYCRREIREDAEWCPYCEQYISLEDAPAQPRPWWIVVGVLACLAALLWWIVGLN